MPAFLVTGNPGSGKSALAQELARRGLATIDADDDPELSYWEDDAGNQMLFVDGPPAPDRDREWLRAHHWVWSRSRMEELLGQHDGLVFVCGIALNLDRFLDLFDQVFVLQIDEATQEARLVAYEEGNPPGRGEAGRQQIRDVPAHASDHEHVQSASRSLFGCSRDACNSRPQ